MGIQLSGLGPSVSRPYTAVEIAFNRGNAGGAVGSRDILLIANKVSSVGSASVDGLGSALNTPWPILEGETEVINRAGYHSEALLLYKTLLRANKSSKVWLAIVPPGTGSGTFDMTLANASTAVGSLKIECVGEAIEVPIASGDSADSVKTLAIAAINAQLHWPVVASSGGVGIVTVTSSMAGTRHDHHLTMMRFTMTKPNAMTATKGAVTPGSTDDDQTTLIQNLEAFPIYYQVNPKQVTSGVTSTDNGIGEHVAAMATWVAPTIGSNCVLITGSEATPSQATTVAVSINQPWAFHFHAEDSDWSPGMIAAHCAGILAFKELTDYGASLGEFGIKKSTDAIYVPDPFDKADRATVAEIETMLANGVSPIAFTPSGKPFITRHITTKCQSNSVADYRARSGHMPSVGYRMRDNILSIYRSVAQDKTAADPVDGEKPLPGFTYPRDIKAIISQAIDIGIDDEQILDPSMRQQMKDSIVVERTNLGMNARVNFYAVRHLYQFGALAEEVSANN